MTEVLDEPVTPVTAAAPPRPLTAIAAGGIAYVRAILAGEAEPPPLPPTRRWELVMQLCEPFPDANTRRMMDDLFRVRDHFGGKVVVEFMTAAGHTAVLACGSDEIAVWRTAAADGEWLRGVISVPDPLAPADEYEEAILAPSDRPPGW